jgi:hypothetical protein
LIGFLNGTSVKEQGAAMLLKFSNFMRNEKETVKMSICGGGLLGEKHFNANFV